MRTRRSGTFWPVALIASALVTSVVVATVWGLRQDAEGAAGARTPRTTASAAPSATPAGTVGPMSLDPSGGLVVNLGGHGIGVRSETDPTVFFRVDNRTQFAVSATGRLAYWRTGPDDDAGGALPHELHVFDLATRADRTLLTLTDRRAGSAGFMVWSTDGTGIAFATHSVVSAFEGRFSPTRPAVSEWKLLDVASGTIATVGSIAGAWLVPLSWDRASGLASATEIGRDASPETTTYYTYTDATRRMLQLRLPAPMEPLGIRVSSRGDTALGIERECDGNGSCPPTSVWTWRLADPAVRERHRVPTGYAETAMFRPGTRDVFVLHRVSEGHFRLEDWGEQGRAAPREILALALPLWPHFRQDGSGVFVVGILELGLPGSLVDPDSAGSAVPLTSHDEVIGTIGGRP